MEEETQKEMKEQYTEEEKAEKKEISKERNEL